MPPTMKKSNNINNKTDKDINTTNNNSLNYARLCVWDAYKGDLLHCIQMVLVCHAVTSEYMS